MKKIIVLAVSLLVAGAAVCFGQNESAIKGRIIDRKSGEPVGFATVAVLRADSSVVAGTMAEEDGRFELKAAQGPSILKVALVGYKDIEKDINVSGQILNVGELALEEDLLVLEGAVVQAQLPRTELKGDAVVTNIAGSVLEHAGNAQDLMAKVPGMIRHNGKLEVIGRGEPVYYINGRRVLDPDELRSLMSEEVRLIEVVNNPGAGYGGEIKSVVRIKTIRRQGEGFSFALTSEAKKYLKTKDFDPSWTVLDLNYRKGGVDFIGKLTYWDNHGYQCSDIWEEAYIPGKLYSQEGTMDVRQHAGGLQALFGINWQINENHSVGFQVQNKTLLFGNYKETVEEDVFMNSLLTDHLTSVNDCNMLKSGGWLGNVYYSGKVEKLEIEFNTDFQTNDESNRTVIEESSQVEPRHIKSDVDNSSAMLASKLVFKYPVWKGQVQAGVEEIYARTWQQHHIDFAEIASSESEIKENTIAGFAEYSLPLKFGQFSVGVRYEHVDFKYNDISGTNDLDRKQDNWFPSASFSTKIGQVGISASVSGKTMRPGFWKLSNEVQYHSRFTYQTGDPTLRNEKYIDAGLNVNWNWLTFSATYENIRDAIEQSGYPYGDDGVIMLKYVNLDSPINVFSAYLVAAPTKGCWSPQYTVGVRKQFFDLEVKDIRETTGTRTVGYNKPMFVVQLNNSFRFKKSWQFSADYMFQSKMSYGAAEVTANRNLLELSVQKSFLKDDALTVRLSAYDILNCTPDNAFVDYGQFKIAQNSDYKSPAIILRVSYHFNTASNKYKGTGAGDSVKNRF